MEEEARVRFRQSDFDLILRLRPGSLRQVLTDGGWLA